jgi:hypothetical protein
MIKVGRSPLLLQKTIEDKLHKFTDILDLCICNRCFYARHQSEKWLAHHHGNLSIELSNNQNVTSRHVDDWLMDTEHGFLHCFLVAFFALEQMKIPHEELLSLVCSSENWLEKLLVGCLLHDFARFAGAAEEGHDQKLRHFFPDLSEDVYTHSNPIEETPLVIGDRIELRRFPYWRDWVSVDVSKYTTNETEVNYFYKSIRPVLARIFEGRYELWVRHGAEVETDFSKGVFPQGVNMPPMPNRKPARPDQQPSVDIGKFFTFVSTSSRTQNCLFDHSQWWSPRCCITIDRLKELGARCVPCGSGRDHLCIESLSGKFQLPIEEWVVLYDYYQLSLSTFSTPENVVSYTMGIEEDLAIKILSCTEKISERIKVLLND